ncbi:MAG: AraC family transcriptional regulator [Fibrella sp.]|nr:AraC family transcriptional regulator [Armatimonadota bacterium]
MKPSAREQYGNDATPAGLTPEIQTLGWDRFKTATRESLAPHRHARACEICYLVDGRVDWWVESETYTLRRGDLYITRPGEWHGGVHSVMHPCELFWVQVVPDILPNVLREGITGLTRRVFPGSVAIADLYETLLVEHRHASVLCDLAARAALHSLLIAVVRDASHESIPEALSPAVVSALSLLASDLSAPLTVEQVAQIVGLSAPRLVERFLCEVGETPGEWRTRRRLQAAQSALREENATVTETAFRFGFASSQYFATAFKRQFGLSPTQWLVVSGEH